VTKQARWTIQSAPDSVELLLSGRWQLADGLPDVDEVVRQIKDARTNTQPIQICGQSIDQWDSSLPAFLAALQMAATRAGLTVSAKGFAPGVSRLLALARPARPSPGPATKASWLEIIGRTAWNAYKRVFAWCLLAGLIVRSLWMLVSGRARVPITDLIEHIQEAGPKALPIVTLLAFLIGAITAFVGVVQLRLFGAELYMADLVGLGMLLEMGALMTAIILAGRAGAAYAAAIGTMQTNEEVDALQTLGFDPVEFLVMPRVLALTLMTPLLTLYADFMGILGGAMVGVSLLDMSPLTYFTQTASAVHLSDALKGLVKSVAYGALIGFAGCLRGIECGRSAMAVGQATTSAVVTSIVLIVLADAFITVLYMMMDGML
jgi:phospholipid/cholesterol/gamma-HCH transport system permease protein